MILFSSYVSTYKVRSFHGVSKYYHVLFICFMFISDLFLSDPISLLCLLLWHFVFHMTHFTCEAFQWGFEFGFFHFEFTALFKFGFSSAILFNWVYFHILGWLLNFIQLFLFSETIFISPSCLKIVIIMFDYITNLF